MRENGCALLWSVLEFSSGSVLSYKQCFRMEQSGRVLQQAPHTARSSAKGVKGVGQQLPQAKTQVPKRELESICSTLGPEKRSRQRLL